METAKEIKPNTAVAIIFRVFLCVLVLVTGLGVMRTLAGMKKPPAEAEKKERALRVETVRVFPEDVDVIITGVGEARAKDMVQIAPEVGGRVTAVHPSLEVGKLIPRGEALFSIDPVNYKAACDIAAAAVDQTKGTIERLKKQYSVDQERLRTIVRNKELAQAEFERVKSLFESNQVGTRSGVDRAESAFNSAMDLADQVALAVDLHPIQIQEAKSALDSALARLTTAKADLERTTVRAPFDGRVMATSVEKGQFVQPGAPVVTLADDSELEILVPVDSRDARDWLHFKAVNGPAESAWFGHLEQGACKVRWTEDDNGHYWEGLLDRVVEFDNKTRTVTLAVKIPAANALSRDEDRLPLVEGMFCKVEIPGKKLRQVMRVPRWAVSFENTVSISSQGRLKTLPVTVARVQEGEAYISKGLAPGDQVIVTRLSDPLENALLDVAAPEGKGSES